MRINTNPRGITTPNYALLGLFTKAEPWKRTDILRDKRINTKRENVAVNFRDSLRERETRKTLGQRVGLVKRLKSGYSVVGLGQLNTRDFNHVHIQAKDAGYTHLRFGGRVFPVSPKEVTK